MTAVPIDRCFSRCRVACPVLSKILKDPVSLVLGSWAYLALALCVMLIPHVNATETTQVIAAVRPSVVAVGTYQRLRSPAFKFLGTGFAVATGAFVATCAHVLPLHMDREVKETLVVVAMGPDGTVKDVRAAALARSDVLSDMAVLSVEGVPLKPLRLAEPEEVVFEGMELLFTGFPLGAGFGLTPVTHRAMVSALPPMALPQTDASKLDPRLVKRLAAETGPVIQLDAAAYPGSSGSPLYDRSGRGVVGVISSVLMRGSRDTGGIQPANITFAVPILALRELLASLPDISRR